jgi:hypothetical protein
MAKALFGIDFDGTLVRDRYAAYNGIGRDWQACLAHIITKAKEISREQALLPESEMDAAAGPFCERLMDLASRLCLTGQNLKSGDIPWKAAARIEKLSVKELSALCKQPLSFQTRGDPPGLSRRPPNRNFCLPSSGDPGSGPLIIMRNNLFVI